MGKPRRVVALVAGLGWHVADLSRAARVVGVGFEPVPFPSVVGRIGLGAAGRITAGNVALDEADGVLVRMMPPGSLEQVVFRMDALHRVEAAGVPVVNPPRAVEAAVDKYLALARVEAAGLAVPPTWAGESARAALDACRALGGDVVIKPLFGSEGRGLVRVADPESAWRVCHALEQLRAVIYVQQFLPNPGHDVRAFVLDGRVLGAIRRHTPPGDWRSNVAVGGRAEAIALDAELAALASRAAWAVGAVAAGVDLLFDRAAERWVVLEVNAVPGWRALAAATGVDVAAALLDDLRERAR